MVSCRSVSVRFVQWLSSCKCRRYVEEYGEEVVQNFAGLIIAALRPRQINAELDDQFNE